MQPVLRSTWCASALKVVSVVVSRGEGDEGVAALDKVKAGGGGLVGYLEDAVFEVKTHSNWEFCEHELEETGEALEGKFRKMRVDGGGNGRNALMDAMVVAMDMERPPEA